MLRVKSIVLAFLSAISLLFFTAPVLAGGWPIYNYGWDNPNQWSSGAPKMSYIRSHLDPGVPCKGTTVTFKYENPESGDNISMGGSNNSYTFTEDNFKVVNGKKIPDCSTSYVKFFSTNNTQKTAIIEYKTADGKVYSSKYVLNFQLSTPGNTESEDKNPLPWEEDYAKKSPSPSPVPTSFPMPQAPDIIYPKDGQTLDLEGVYMFKVNPVKGASGYLFGLFQDDVMVYENYRDGKTLSSNGEFALWESNPGHAKFHAGDVRVMIRALVNNQWTDARTITIHLEPGCKGCPVPVISPRPSAMPSSTPQLYPQQSPPNIPPSQIIVVTDSSVSAALQAKVNELQKKLEQSQQKQSILEERLNQIISWIKSIFPFFK